RRRLRRDFCLEVATALWITRQMAEALAALHQKGFIHGDVKPDNIRIVDDGSAVLLDLGFAHRPGENAAFIDRGYVLGTVNYLAPEMCGPKPQDDPRSDIFSLGLTLYEMISGQLPYPQGSLEQTVASHEIDEPRDIRQHGLDLPAELPHLLERLLARKPEQRPRAHALVQQLIPLEIASLGRRQAA